MARQEGVFQTKVELLYINVIATIAVGFVAVRLSHSKSSILNLGAQAISQPQGLFENKSKE